MHKLLMGALFVLRQGASISYSEADMKIVVWKSPKYLSKLLSKVFGVEKKDNGKEE